MRFDVKVSPTPRSQTTMAAADAWLNMQRQLFARSERVKGIDFHPTEPWVLTTPYSGHVHIWSYETGTTIKTFELTDVLVRAGRRSRGATGSWLRVGRSPAAASSTTTTGSRR